MPHSIEEKAKKILIKKLKAAGSDVRESDLKTFDLIVDGEYVEIKAKNKSLKELDFISLSDKQYNTALKENFDIYLVCGLDNPNPEIYRIKASKLIKQRARKVLSYEFDRTVLEKICKKFK